MKLLACSLLAVGLLGTACKKKSNDNADPVPVATGDAAVVVAADAAVAASDIAFGPGESYYGGKASPTNVMEWKLEDGTVLRLVVVTTGTADGRQQGVLRVYRDGKGVDIGEKFSIANTGENWAELKQLPNGRVAFRFGDTGEGRRARNVIVLRYDNAAKEVRIAKRWSADAKAAEPEWMLTGTTASASKAGTDLCTKIVARIVACAKDEGFRKAVFARDEANRETLTKDLDASVATWSKPADAQKQCEKWASDDVVETTFSDEVKLAHLGKEASEKTMPCDAFGREIVDEGGLPPR